MSVIHCDGHKFVVHTRSVKFRSETIVMQDGFICEGCDLKVKTVEAATYLEGKTC